MIVFVSVRSYKQTDTINVYLTYKLFIQNLTCLDKNIYYTSIVLDKNI